jgi:RNA polymerase sigma-70 factor (ECF subfamily)
MADKSIAPPSLASRVQEGDSSAEDELVRYYLPTLRFILRRDFHDPDLVDDVLQDTFIALIQNLRQGKLENPAALSAYARTIARNKANEFLRKESRSTATNPQVMDAMSSVDDLLGKLEQDDLAELARKAIDSLPQARDRQLLRMFYYYDMDKRVLCEQFEISPANFDRVKHRALQRLQILVKKMTKHPLPVSMLVLMLVVTATKGRIDG